ncbi:MAG: FAD-binding oxidoreductase [Candidatus Vogelbacteria bacterium CG10_big_fil_rev_8_21_14_0_10_51_16]|uniref:D-lactate dehydrogenase (cytochrome) n=1 Tax=Candidatus Vogelbacteria bacterium CG10_big_fil_rev_8_21_14_0_10_51_16 TaxID=1975045 RepID=A0A2H0RE30_9BACT|nr:MAG: FAD-binding oxidoreductase [Candidatus Vogelbacteria bacterium CG10_big_fil_rev_8_21_14_0_10_51_16]
MTLAQQLQMVVRGEVMADEATLETYSRDASLFRVCPQVVVFPRDVDDVKHLVKFVRKEREAGRHISLTARAAGTDMSGGPLSTSIVMVFTRHMNHLREIGPDYAVVEPGMYYRDFERETLKHNLIFPSYPASRELCALGGIVANNAGGEKSLSYGKTERYVRAVKMVLEDGEEYEFKPLTLAALEAKKRLHSVEGDLYRKLSKLVFDHEEELKLAKPQVGKNSSGYALWNVYNRERGLFDPTQLIVGSQGTLGIITEITLGLVRPKPHARLLVIFLNDMARLGEIDEAVLAHRPESFESYDDHTFNIALRFLPQLAKQMGLGMVRMAWSFLPELLMALRGGAPKLVLMAEFTAESDEEAEAQAHKAEAALKPFDLRTKVTASEAENKKYWTVRRESFNMLRHHVRGKRTAPFIDDIVVRPDLLPKFLPQLYAIMERYPITYTIAGHIGGGNFHIIPLMDMSDPKSVEIIKKLGAEVYALVFRYKGSMSGEHNDGLIRGPYLEQMYGERIFGLFKEVKKIFDPFDIFNPGKKTEVNSAFALTHLDMGA